MIGEKSTARGLILVAARYVGLSVTPRLCLRRTVQFASRGSDDLSHEGSGRHPGRSERAALPNGVLVSGTRVETLPGPDMGVACVK
jgi:hypothetical protein